MTKIGLKENAPEVPVQEQVNYKNVNLKNSLDELKYAAEKILNVINFSTSIHSEDTKINRGFMQDAEIDGGKVSIEIKIDNLHPSSFLTALNELQNISNHLLHYLIPTEITDNEPTP